MIQQKQVGEIILAPQSQEQYVIKKMLGQGTAGCVYLVELLQRDSQIPSSMYAMKVQTILEKNEEEIMRLLMNNPNPNILNIQKYWQSNGIFFILMDLASDGNLFEFIEKNKNKLSSQNVFEMFHQLCLGVLQLHKLNIIHRDLKPENILVQTSPKNQNTFTLKICDYGLCKKSTITQTKNIGTIYYMAPELLKNTGGYTKSIDIWALGCIWYILVAKDDLFTGQSQQEIKQILENVTQQKIDDSIERLNLKDWEKQLMKSMINIIANKRPNIEQILQQINQQAKPQYTSENIQSLFAQLKQEFQIEIKSLRENAVCSNQNFNQVLQRVQNNVKDLDQQFVNLQQEMKQLPINFEQYKIDSQKLLENQISAVKKQIDQIQKQEIQQNENIVDNKIKSLEQNLSQQIMQQQQQYMASNQDRDQQFVNLQQKMQQQLDQQFVNLQQEMKQLPINFEQYKIDSQKLLENQISAVKKQIDQIQKQEIQQNENIVDNKIKSLEQNLSQQIMQQQQQYMASNQDRDQQFLNLQQKMQQQLDQQFVNLQQEMKQLPINFEQYKIDSQKLLENQISAVKKQIDQIQKQEIQQNENIVDNKIKSLEQNLSQQIMQQQQQYMASNQDRDQQFVNLQQKMQQQLDQQFVNLQQEMKQLPINFEQYKIDSQKLLENQISAVKKQIDQIQKQEIQQNENIVDNKIKSLEQNLSQQIMQQQQQYMASNQDRDQQFVNLQQKMQQQLDQQFVNLQQEMKQLPINFEQYKIDSQKLLENQISAVKKQIDQIQKQEIQQNENIVDNKIKSLEQNLSQQIMQQQQQYMASNQDRDQQFVNLQQKMQQQLDQQFVNLQQEMKQLPINFEQYKIDSQKLLENQISAVKKQIDQIQKQEIQQNENIVDNKIKSLEQNLSQQIMQQQQQYMASNQDRDQQFVNLQQKMQQQLDQQFVNLQQEMKQLPINFEQYKIDSQKLLENQISAVKKQIDQIQKQEIQQNENIVDNKIKSLEQNLSQQIMQQQQQYMASNQDRDQQFLNLQQKMQQQLDQQFVNLQQEMKQLPINFEQYKIDSQKLLENQISAVKKQIDQIQKQEIQQNENIVDNKIKSLEQNLSQQIMQQQQQYMASNQDRDQQFVNLQQKMQQQLDQQFVNLQQKMKQQLDQQFVNLQQEMKQLPINFEQYKIDSQKLLENQISAVKKQIDQIQKQEIQQNENIVDNKIKSLEQNLSQQIMQQQQQYMASNQDRDQQFVNLQQKMQQQLDQQFVNLQQKMKQQLDQQFVNLQQEMKQLPINFEQYKIDSQKLLENQISAVKKQIDQIQKQEIQQNKNIVDNKIKSLEQNLSQQIMQQQQQYIASNQNRDSQFVNLQQEIKQLRDQQFVNLQQKMKQLRDQQFVNLQQKMKQLLITFKQYIIDSQKQLKNHIELVQSQYQNLNQKQEHKYRQSNENIERIAEWIINFQNVNQFKYQQEYTNQQQQQKFINQSQITFTPSRVIQALPPRYIIHSVVKTNL